VTDDRKKILCDTNILLIASQKDPPKALGDLLASPSVVRHYSTAAIWEMVIKDMLGKLNAGITPWDVKRALNDNGYKNLPITDDHALELRALKSLHKDPFDRIMLAQARYEKLTLVTTDAKLAEYGIDCMVIKR
jgi:PIN domain nuclease of toxin-antitoxin system